MNNNLSTSFAQLTHHLAAGKSPLIHLFQDPIDRHTVNKQIEGLNISLPEEVYELYNWHNGTRETEEYTFAQLWMFPLGIFVPIESSIDRYHHYAGKDGCWEKSMFMLFEGGGGEMFLIDCDPNSPTYRQILKHNYGAVNEDIVTSKFDSLQSLFVSIVECFEKKGYFHDATGGIEFDYKIEVPIMKKNNPNSKYWNVFDWMQ